MPQRGKLGSTFDGRRKIRLLSGGILPLCSGALVTQISWLHRYGGAGERSETEGADCAGSFDAPVIAGGKSAYCLAVFYLDARLTWCSLDMNFLAHITICGMGVFAAQGLRVHSAEGFAHRRQPSA